jgi:type II secretory pathway component PulC
MFGFEQNEGEEARTAETVPPVAFEGSHGVVLVGDGGVIQPTRPGGAQIGHLAAPRWKPNRTQQVSANLFQLGTEDVAEFNESYAEILAKDIDYKQYRNPKTGQVDGIEITKVAKGSLPASHGVQEGEVLKSINGHKVTTVNEAIAYVKKNADTTSEWVAVFERNGREVVRTYKSPPRD